MGVMGNDGHDWTRFHCNPLSIRLKYRQPNEIDQAEELVTFFRDDRYNGEPPEYPARREPCPAHRIQYAFE